MRISVCMIVKNERHNLPECIASIPELYEIVIVDTGSTDGTVDYLTAEGITVHHAEWNNDFAAMRNISISKATGSHILILDADERLASGAEKEIVCFVKQHNNSVGLVTIRNFLDDGTSIHQAPRFFPNSPEYRFEGSVHETIKVNGTDPTYRTTGAHIDHYGYLTEQYKKNNKEGFYLGLYQDYLGKSPHDGYMLYQLGKLHYSLKHYVEAERAFVRCLATNEVNKTYFPVMLTLYGYTLKETGRSQHALELLAPYIDIYKDYPDMFFLIGLLAMDLGEVGLIETSFLKALEIGEAKGYSSVEGVGSYKAAYNLGLFYEIFNHRQEAKKYYELAAGYGYQEARERMNTLH